MARKPITVSDLHKISKKFHRTKKKKTYQKTGKIARLRDYHPKTDIESMIKAKVLWLGSAGEMPHTRIAKQVGVKSQTIKNWRKKYEWDLEMGTIRKQVTDKMAEKMATNPDMQHMLSCIPEEKIKLAVNALIGKTMAEAIGEFLAEVHQQDLIDLAKINAQIRRHLPDIIDIDSRLMHPQAIKFLVEAKIAVIKAVRDIFSPVLGIDKDGKGATFINNQQIIEVTLVGQPSESFGRLLRQGAIKIDSEKADEKNQN